MIVTNIEKQKNSDERYNIFIDEQYMFSATAEDIYRNGLKKGIKIESTEKLNEIIHACEYTKAFSYALDIMAFKTYSTQEMINKLNKRKFSEQTISKIIAKLIELKLLDDKAFIERYTTDCLHNKKYGNKKIKYMLSGKGFDKSEIAEAQIDSEVELNNCIMIAEKKLALLEGKKNAKEKLYRFLLSRGYDYDMIGKVLNQLFKSEY